MTDKASQMAELALLLGAALALIAMALIAINDPVPWATIWPLLGAAGGIAALYFVFELIFDILSTSSEGG